MADYVKSVTDTWTDIAVNGAWLGMTDLYSYDPMNPEMEWYPRGPPDYTNWAFGEPEITQTKWPGGTCASLDSTDSMLINNK